MKHNKSFDSFRETFSYRDTTANAVKQDIFIKTITCIILAFVSGILTLLNIYKHFSFMTVTTVVMTLGMIMAAVLCGRFKRADAATVLVSILLIIIFTDYAVNGENQGFAILWITMVPMVCMLWMGMKVGFLLSLYFQGLLIVLFYTPIRDSMSAHYTQIFMTRFPILYLGIFIVSSWIFYQKLKSQMLSDKAGRMDALTKTDNRLGFNLKLASIFQRGAVPVLHVMVFDINRLKYVNDEFGHKAGDEIIIGACDVITRAFPDYSIFARVGGDEFYMVSTALDFDFEKGETRLKSLTNNWKGDIAPFLSISCGHACGKEVTEDNYHKLLNIADQEMYKSKTRFYQGNSIDRRRR